MQKIEHFGIKAKDGAMIPVTAYNLDDDTKKGIVIICHGFGEHSGAYIEFAERLWQGGYACVSFDQRGHGKPPDGAKKWHGVVPNYTRFIDDVFSVTEMITETSPGTPIALFGHSMGGNIVINTLLRLPEDKKDTYICAMLDSPWFDINKPLSPAAVCVLRVMNLFIPNYRNYKKLKSKDISGDRVKKEGYVKDPYYHGFISMRMLTGIMDASKYAIKNASKLPVKVYLACADKEAVVSRKAMSEFAVKAGNIVTLREYSSYHAIYKDINREPYCCDLISFLDSNLRNQRS